MTDTKSGSYDEFNKRAKIRRIIKNFSYDAADYVKQQLDDNSTEYRWFKEDNPSAEELFNFLKYHISERMDYLGLRGIQHGEDEYLNACLDVQTRFIMSTYYPLDYQKISPDQNSELLTDILDKQFLKHYEIQI